MIIDSSALVAIVFQERGFEGLLRKIESSHRLGIGVPTLVETCIVISARLKSDARGLVARLMQELSISTIPFGEAHYGVAVDAFLRFGKGRHRADLNFGDCLSYAAARVAGWPLLCVGDDFAKTDIELAQ